ncbi:MAG: DUF3465 domain-containing protein [Propionibacteriaceae bacterium]|jgi:hypothetical protein|nr:DUF3465 domain-containing protein [Propionibacteriaceae bacterium]
MSSRTSKTTLPATVVVIVLLAGAYIVGQSGLLGSGSPDTPATTTDRSDQTPAGAAATATKPTAPDNVADASDIDQLYQDQAADVEVTGSAVVSRLLSDDFEGDRHQRFILRFDSGLTVLVAHNIDIAPRLDGLTVGYRVSFRGEYVYSEQGGTIHWTHHSPDGSHSDGWLEWNGKRYS